MTQENLAEKLKALEELSDSPPRSKLEPYRVVILRWRRRGWTYRRISETLAAECKLSVSHIAVRKFVKRAARPRKPQPALEMEPATILQAVEHLPANPPARKPRKLSAEEAAQQRALIQALRNKPVAVPEVRKRYEYNPDEPLTLERTPKDQTP
jgi:hypothetical protein